MKITQGQIVVFVFSLLGRLPLTACRLLGRAFGFLLWVFPNRNRSTTQRNIAHCFADLSIQEQRKLVFNSLQHSGMLIFEMAIIWSKPYSWLEQRIRAFENIELFQKAQTRERGLIILLPHLGNWEVFSRYIPAVCDGVGLYEPSRSVELGQFIKAQREKTGAKMVPTTARGVATLLRHLKQGGTTCILPDQVPNQKDRSGVFAPFFGHPCYTMTLVNQLHQRTNAIILGAVARRVRGGFVLRFYPVDDTIYSKDNVLSVSAMNAFVEACVRDTPEQYQWEYKRFRRVPKDTKRIY
jgi:Kdo2-lipid IVA lauroyltransferase/acyltransferase